jgi:1-acyl-sn-glycerol-3-phosphate acyltransferase
VVGLVTKILHPVTVEGLETLPDSGVLLCPNHSSNWDPILVALNLPINYRLHIMAKEELFQNPLLGWLLRKVGAFPVSRGNNDINTVRTSIQTIKDGDNLLIFPEGTTIHNGIGYVDGLPAHAKAGVAMIGVRTGAKLVPVFVDGEKKLFHRTRIIFGSPYEPHYTGRRGTSDEMQKIANDLLEAAYALGGQAVGGAPL